MPRANKGKNQIAPRTPPRRKKPPADTVPAEGKKPRGPRTYKQSGALSPVQIRVLDLLFDVRCSTLSDVAELANIRVITIRNWMTNDPAFVAEYNRRLHATGDEIARLNTQAVTLAFEFHMEVLKNADGKYTHAERAASAKAILDLNRPRIDMLHVTQVVNAPASTATPAATPPSVQRFTAQGVPQQEALRLDVRETIIALEQLEVGAMSVQSEDPNEPLVGELVPRA